MTDKTVNKMAQVGVIMGSISDKSTLEVCVSILSQFNVDYEWQVISAHRTPDLMFEYAKLAKSKGLKVIIAAAGGAAHLPGMVASQTDLPVIGVPVESKSLSGLDSLLSIVQMPKGTPVATVSIGETGGVNAAFLALKILAINDSKLSQKLSNYRKEKASQIAKQSNIHVNLLHTNTPPPSP